MSDIINNFIEEVILVDELNNILGKAPKATVHTENTPLHQAFSCFIFNKKGQILLQQRSHLKKTWPLAWSNSCCGHPMPNEELYSAVKRRVLQELGISMQSLELISSYRYQFTRYGIMENEICPIFVATSNQEPNFDPAEIESIKWLSWANYLKNLKKDKPGSEGIWSEWCKEEVEILEKNPRFLQLKKLLGI